MFHKEAHHQVSSSQRSFLSIWFLGEAECWSQGQGPSVGDRQALMVVQNIILPNRLTWVAKMFFVTSEKKFVTILRLRTELILRCCALRKYWEGFTGKGMK
jgi:hypothetical protein